MWKEEGNKQTKRGQKKSCRQKKHPLWHSAAERPAVPPMSSLLALCDLVERRISTSSRSLFSSASRSAATTAATAAASSSGTSVTSAAVTLSRLRIASSRSRALRAESSEGWGVGCRTHAGRQSKQNGHNSHQSMSQSRWDGRAQRRENLKKQNPLTHKKRKKHNYKRNDDNQQMDSGVQTVFLLLLQIND